jgi:hypothetical protein
MKTIAYIEHTIRAGSRGARNTRSHSSSSIVNLQFHSHRWAGVLPWRGSLPSSIRTCGTRGTRAGVETAVP